MIRFTIGSDEPQSDEAKLASTCLLFKAGDDSVIPILSYLSIVNICRLDTALTNAAARVNWLRILRRKNHRTINNHKHSNRSIIWLVERGISPEYLEIDGTINISNRMNGVAFLGLNISSLRSVTFCQCKNDDEDMLPIAHGCPNLREIRLYD